jgi:predicted cation transporter
MEPSMHIPSQWSLKSAILESWLGIIALVGFALVTFTSHSEESKILAGGLILIAAVMSMNGWMRSDLAVKTEGEHWWRHHPILKPLHFITNEGELAGILVGGVVIVMMVVTGHVHDLQHAIQHNFHLGLTLYGIMSAANLAVIHMLPIMAFLEDRFGTRAAVILGSLLSSLTGEPAAAVFLGDFIKDRVRDEDRSIVATGLAAAIGSGGGLMPFAAPPVLIVWGTLSMIFGWGIPQLIAYLGVGCVLHVVTSSFAFVDKIQPRNGTNEGHRLTKQSILPLGWLTILIVWHIEAPGMLLWGADIATGILATLSAKQQFAKMPNSSHEEVFTAMWQPLILGVLLLAIELIGHAGDPLVKAIAAQIPNDWSPLAIGYILFIATAVVSHFADNALASRVFMAVPVAMISDPSVGLPIGSFLAACVVMGALFGGFLTIPANLPNFYIARVFRVDSKAWLKVSWKLYLTGIAYVLWIVIRFTIG